MPVWVPWGPPVLSLFRGCRAEHGGVLGWYQPLPESPAPISLSASRGFTFC